MLRDTTSRGLCVRVWPPHNSERRVRGPRPGPRPRRLFLIKLSLSLSLSLAGEGEVVSKKVGKEVPVTGKDELTGGPCPDSDDRIVDNFGKSRYRFVTFGEKT